MAEVVNIVAAGNLRRELNVSAVAEDIDAADVTANKEGYATPTIYVRGREGGPLVTMYESGSFHVSGATSQDEINEAVRWLVGALEALGIDGLEPEYDIKNVVIVGDLERSVDLNRLSILLGLENVEYEPEQFPGLIYRPPDLPSVFLVFSSGRVVIPGSSSERQGFDALDWLVEQFDVEIPI